MWVVTYGAKKDAALPMASVNHWRLTHQSNGLAWFGNEPSRKRKLYRDAARCKPADAMEWVDRGRNWRLI